jgi:hypothetical protein
VAVRPTLTAAAWRRFALELAGVQAKNRRLVAQSCALERGRLSAAFLTANGAPAGAGGRR